VRDIIDMTDAVAQDAMERAIAIDAIADQELAAADQINTNVQSATPGSARSSKHRRTHGCESGTPTRIGLGGSHEGSSGSI